MTPRLMALPLEYIITLVTELRYMIAHEAWIPRTPGLEGGANCSPRRLASGQGRQTDVTHPEDGKPVPHLIRARSSDRACP